MSCDCGGSGMRRPDGVSETRIRDASLLMSEEYRPPAKRRPPTRWSVVEVKGDDVDGWAMFDRVSRTTGTIHEFKSDAEAQLLSLSRKL